MPAITIDASALDGVNWSTFISNYISGLGNGSYKFYGGGMSAAYGSQFAMSGEQLAIQYATDTATRVVLEGTDLAYDSIVYGASYGHGLSGALDKITFGQWIEGTTGTPGIGDDGLIAGLQQDLVITGLDIEVAIGSGPAGNILNTLFTQIPGGNATALNTLLSGYAQNFIGTAGDDTYVGTAQADTINGCGGNDTLDGGDGDDVVVFDGDFGGASGTYSFAANSDGSITITDSRATGGTGVDVINNIEILKFNNLTYNLTTHVANYAPTDIVFDDAAAADLNVNSQVGAAVATFAVTDRNATETFTYELLNDAGGQFVLDGASVKVADVLAPGRHTITVRATDSAGQSVERQLTVEIANPPSITIDASGANGMDFEAYIRGGFLDGTSGGGMPVFDNGSSFAGEEMFIGYGNTSASKYVLMHGALEYHFGTHTVAGTANVVEYGTRGTGSFDSNGYFAGGNAELRISGLALSNLVPADATEANTIKANGPIHNFAVAHMYGASGELARLAKYADALDAYSQNFIGSAGNDTYTGTRFNDTMTGGGGDDSLDGGAGTDVVVYDGVYARNGGDYTFTIADGVITMVDSRVNGTGTDTLRNIEILKFGNLTYDLTTHRVNYVPTDVALASNDPVQGNSAVGTSIANLVVTDALISGVADTHTFTLLNNAGGHFVLDGASVKVASALTADSYTIRVRVTDSAGQSIEKNITINVSEPAVNLAPTGLSLSKTSIAENNAANAVVGVVSAVDPEGDAITYALTGNAGGRFALVTSGGQTRLVATRALDHEAAASHQVTLTATDAFGNVTSKAFTITVGDVNEAPVITSNGGGAAAAIRVAENGTAVTTARATDPEGQAIKWTITGGADAALFTINAATGALVFKSAPDFEAPKDAGRDNVYDLVIRATDAGGLTDSQAIKVTVTDVAGRSITGTSGADRLAGTAENDTLNGGKGADTMTGGKGHDTYIVDHAGDKVVELVGGGVDLVRASVSYKLASQVENLTLTGKANLNGEGNGLANVVTGNAGHNILKGGNGHDRLIGNGGADTLVGGAGNDTLQGGAGNDRLQGGKGADALYGGSGRDTFVFASLSDSTVKASGRDTVYDFNGKAGDRIALGAIDANTKLAGDQAFDFIGTKAFTKTAGELRYHVTKGDAILTGDVNGDGKADFAVLLDDVTSLSKGFFIL